jgi:nucleoid DNA-binding protein
MLGASMKREELARTLARQTNLSRAAARDEVDELVHRILKTLRKGETVEFPGVGKLVARDHASVNKARRESR